MLKQLLLPATLLAVLACAPPSFAWNSTEGVTIETPVEGVTVITVTASTLSTGDFEGYPPALHTSNYTTVVVDPGFDRFERLRRALGQRYLGFKRVYSGLRYPF